MQPALTPIYGALAFLGRPSLWRAVVMASPLVTILFSAGVLGSLVWYWPVAENQIVWSLLANWLLVVAAIFVVLIPFCRGRAGIKILVPYLGGQGCTVDEDARRTLFARIRYFFATIPWRVLWALAAFGGWSIDPFVGLAVGAWGIGHTTMMDAADQALLVGGFEVGQRSAWIRDNQRDLVMAGAVAGVLFAVAGLVVVGWILWLPACFLAAARLVLPTLSRQIQKEAAVSDDVTVQAMPPEVVDEK